MGFLISVVNNICWNERDAGAGRDFLSQVRLRGGFLTAESVEERSWYYCLLRREGDAKRKSKWVQGTR